ncbi:MAG: potassium transporter [Thermodesulfobacteriota bacterium]
MNRAGVWIIGGGAFGRRGVEILSRRGRPGDLLVVDVDSAALAGLEPGVASVLGDGVEFLVKNLSPGRGPGWIVPCLPLHLAFEWLKARLGPAAEAVPAPAVPAGRLPPPRPAGQGGHLLSYADFICPPDCPEPAEVCTYTGRPRRGDLYADLAAALWPGFDIVVVRSRQLAPGLGGYRPADLFGLEQKARAADSPLLVATACRCHGVLHALRMKK